MQTSEHEVVIAGGGPTGLMLAGELALAGVDVAVVEKRLNQEVEGSRAGGLHPRSIEVLDQRGIADRFVSQGEKHFVAHFAGAVLDASDRPTRHNYTLALWQEKIEQGLADWVADLPVQFYRGCMVADFSEDDSGIIVALNDGRSLSAQYLVGCDGGRSIVRKKAGIGFPGWDPDISYLIFEAELTEPQLGISHGPKGLYAIGPLEGDHRFRGVITEENLERGVKPVIDDMRQAIAAYDTDFGVSNITWLSRFTDAARQAETYRKGRILLAGDAAHVHSPAGGQGLNIGLQDAVNLGWKLAQVANGVSPDSLLDTYHDERHPVGAALLKSTLALTALNRGDERTNALREMMARVMQMDEPRRWYTAMMSGLDVHYYNLGKGHLLLGRRMPDLDITTDDGPTTVFTLLHGARPVLLNLSSPGDIDYTRWEERIRLIDATFEGTLELPAIGEVDTPAAILIRPDGHVAWVGDRDQTGLSEAIARWFGQP